MYNIGRGILEKANVIYCKQFGFPAKHSVGDYAIPSNIAVLIQPEIDYSEISCVYNRLLSSYFLRSYFLIIFSLVICFHRSVARLCVKQRFGEDKLDGDVSEDDKLSKRQLSVLRIRRGQRYIFQRICGLVDQTALPVAETTFLF